MNNIITVYSKEGLSVEIDEQSARTSKYLETVLKEEPDCKEIRTNIPQKFLVIAKKFCCDSIVSSFIVDYHVNKPMAPIPKPLKDYQNFRNNIEDDFDSNLVTGLNRDDVFDLLYTAQILQNESLISLWYDLFSIFDIVLPIQLVLLMERM